MSLIRYVVKSSARRLAWFDRRGGESIPKSVVTLRRGTSALIAYSFSKASVLLAPLLLSRVLSLRNYGTVEYSLSVGQLASVALALGTTSSIPYFLLHRDQHFYRPVFSLHVIIVAVVCLAVAAGAFGAGNSLLSLASLIAGISVNQSVLSAKLRSADNPIGSSVAEGVLYTALLVFGALAYVNVVPPSIAGLIVMLGAYLVGALVLRIVAYPRGISRLRVLRIYRISMAYGIRAVPASLANVGLVSAGRFLIGIVGTLEHVAMFSIVYRICAPIVATHQFLSNLIFRRLYTASTASFQKYFTTLSALLMLTGLALTFCGPALSVELLGQKAKPISHRTDLFALMSLFMIMWSQLSLMELFMGRQNRLHRQLFGFAVGGCIAAACVLVPRWRSSDQLDSVLLFQGLGVGAAVMWQFYQSGVARPRWPVARAIVVAQMMVLSLLWLLTGILWR